MTVKSGMSYDYDDEYEFWKHWSQQLKNPYTEFPHKRLFEQLL